MDWDEAMHANILRAAIRVGQLTPRAAVERRGPWLLIDAGVDMVQFNQAWVAGDAAAAADCLDEALDWFEQREAAASFRLRAPQDDPVAQMLIARDYTVRDSEPAMFLERLEGIDVPPVLDVIEATTPDEIRRYGEVDGPAWHEITRGIARTAAAFPDFTLLLGEVEGQQAATSMAVAHAGIVGIYNVQVRPEFRRRGLGRAITAAAIARGRSEGCRGAALQSTEMGLPLYRSMGFETRYQVNAYTKPGPRK